MRVGTSQSHAIQSVAVWDHRRHSENPEHALIYFFGERLPFGFAALAVSFEAMPQNLMENTAAARPESNAGPSNGSASGAIRSAFRSATHLFLLSREFLFGGESRGLRDSNVSTRTRSIPSSARVLASTTRRAIIPGVPLCCLRWKQSTKWFAGLAGHREFINFRIFPEERGNISGFFFPFLSD